VFPVCIKIKSVFEIINSIRHNDIVREAIPHVYDTITEKILPQFISTSLYFFQHSFFYPTLLKYFGVKVDVFV